MWYRAPAPGLRQVLSGARGLAWQVDLKAGWSHGLAPGAAAERSAYRVLSGDLAKPGDMPEWLAREVIRVARPKSAGPSPGPAPSPANSRRGAAYLTTVINRGAARLIAMSDGRKRALAYQAGGLLGWSGLPAEHVTDWLTEAGTASGLSPRDARRITRRALANGLTRPVRPPSASGRARRAA